jgi:flagellar basal-body rod protein FlgB
VLEVRHWAAQAVCRPTIEAGLPVALKTAMIERIATGLEHYMTLLSTRQKLVASNIANVETPGYHTKDINFQQEFQSAMNAQSPEVIDAQGLYMKNDGNNVNLDRESRLLAEIDLRFSLASNLARSEMKQIRMAMEGGS